MEPTIPTTAQGKETGGGFLSLPLGTCLPLLCTMAMYTPGAGHEGEFTDIPLVFRLLSVWFSSDKDSHGGK